MDRNSYQNLIVFQKALDLVVKAYSIASQLPDIEKYGLASQIRRAVVSIPANIAEGHGRRTNGDFARFLTISLGSCRELETLFLICGRLGYVEDLADVQDDTTQVAKMLNVLIRKIRDNQ
ncbi:MAG: four helix bundle protein [Armatimonadetes bacterium]|nr:four helix bundle protein [Armatimonadota bacterium]